MAVYRNKYILQGLKEITPEMEKDLDLAYDVCMGLREEFHSGRNSAVRCAANAVINPTSSSFLRKWTGYPHPQGYLCMNS